jgi:hypothetical protein
MNLSGAFRESPIDLGELFMGRFIVFWGCHWSILFPKGNGARAIGYPNHNMYLCHCHLIRGEFHQTSF